MSRTPDPIFTARVHRALAYLTGGDRHRFDMYCAGLRAMYRKQRKAFQIEEGLHHVAFQMSIQAPASSSPGTCIAIHRSSA